MLNLSQRITPRMYLVAAAIVLAALLVLAVVVAAHTGDHSHVQAVIHRHAPLADDVIHRH